jgi:hypothetical protein
MLGAVSFGQTAMYDFGGSRWSVGLSGDLSLYAYDRDKYEVVAIKENGVPTGETKRMGEDQQDYGVALYPLAEVNISDKLNLRTVFRPWIFEHNRAQAFGNIERAPWSQSVGLGISVTRDLYLYPNIQFQPLNIKPELTNVAISMNLNI